MARPKKASATVAVDKADSSTIGLLEAIQFVAQAQDTGPSHGQTPATNNHLLLRNKWAAGFDGVLAAGHPITDDFILAPHTGRLLDALKRVGNNLSLTQIGDDRLAVQSTAYRAVVPCLPLDQYFTNVLPDAAIGPCDNRLKEALQAVAPVASEGSQTVLTASVKFTEEHRTVTTCDRHIIMEYWHGVHMPSLVLPKASAVVLAKQPKPMTAFGFSPRTLTIYYEGGTWIRTQLYDEPWPDVTKIWDGMEGALYTDLPPDFFEGVASVIPFNDQKKVYLSGEMISSHPFEQGNDIGARYQCMKLLAGKAYVSGSLMMHTKGHVTRAAFREGKNSYMTGPKMRVALVGST